MDQVKLGKCVRNYAHNALFELNRAPFGLSSDPEKHSKMGIMLFILAEIMYTCGRPHQRRLFVWVIFWN